jgi:excisionase family DNA binding protein
MQAQNRENVLATVKEAAAYLNVSVAKLYEMMKTGQLCFVKLGKSRRVPWAALAELVRRCTLGPA